MKSKSHSGVRVWDLEVDSKTSERLGRVRQRATSAELALRKALHADGHSYRVHNPDLPGRPDIANRTRKWAVFVHGCFWHHHDQCHRATIPKRNRQFWVEKFRANRKRDEANVAALVELGYRVTVVWECELDRDVDAAVRRALRALRLAVVR